MRLINQSVEEITPKSYTFEEIKKFIEVCGRTCYKSEDKISENSYERFYNMIRNSGHTSVLEHGTLYCKMDIGEYYLIIGEDNKAWENSPFKFANITKDGIVYLSTSIACVLANKLEILTEYAVEPEFEKDVIGDYIKHIPRRSFRIKCPISVTRELNRHELILTVSEQSTRYCNYTKDKFNSEVTFIIPKWADIKPGNYLYSDGGWYDPNGSEIIRHHENPAIDTFLRELYSIESTYRQLVNSGYKPQEAREILPLGTASEVVYTAWENAPNGWDWQHIMGLRSPMAGATGVHPMCADIADEIYKKLCGY